MRLGAFVLAASVLAMPLAASAQQYSGTMRREPSTVLRPATTVAWRNYVTAPDGPCGPPMSIETDCYVGCRPCGPLRPFCFLHRVGRMLDCLLPCNKCCRGGCGLGHGCLLGGRLGCNVCCGGQAGCGSCGSCGSCGGCPNPCGSVFDNCCTPSCTTGGHCYGCGSALPGVSDPFQDDPLPPKPTAQPATEVRRSVPRPARPVATQSRMTTAAVQKPASPYKIVASPQAMPSRTVSRPATSGATQKPSRSVLRQASAEQGYYEPAPIKVDRNRATPIIRSQSPDAEDDVPANPLR